MEQKEFKNFSEFYPFYLSEHSHPLNRRLHFFGSSIVLLLLALVIFSQNWVLFFLLPIAGYGFAWVGHFVIEKNRPATFKHPIYSLIGDWVMFLDILRGKIKI